jgi:hypothetical protein
LRPRSLGPAAKAGAAAVARRMRKDNLRMGWAPT